LAVHKTGRQGDERGWLLFLALLLAFSILQFTCFFFEASPGTVG
jgi:hypothetical protein